jgi:hypothetical protein
VEAAGIGQGWITCSTPRFLAEAEVVLPLDHAAGCAFEAGGPRLWVEGSPAGARACPCIGFQPPDFDIAAYTGKDIVHVVRYRLGKYLAPVFRQEEHMRMQQEDAMTVVSNVVARVDRSTVQ